MTVDDKIRKIQEMMKKDHLDGWIVYGSDPHNSEYVCPRWRTRAFLTGFTGSAGTVLVTPDGADLWVDSRYHIQAEAEIKGTCITLFKADKPGVPTFWEYLCSQKTQLHRIGTSADCLMKAELDRMTAEGFEVVPTADYLDAIWPDRPSVPDFPVRQMPDRICGFSAKEKLDQVRSKFGDIDYMMISSLDDIAWVLNLRGNDIAYNPVFLSYLLIGRSDAVLFADRKRFSDEIYDSISNVVRVLPYDQTGLFVGTIEQGKKVALDFGKTNMLIYSSFPAKTQFVNQMDVTTRMKACKNPVELDGMREAHILDGAALVNFLAKVKKNPEGWTEMKLTDTIQAERDKMPGELGPSFGPIAGYAAHGAMCHYSATEKSSSAVKRGLVVLDTGGHYEMGMTDVTRTLLFGMPTADEKRDYTLVLKGHLALFRTHFPEGTCGIQLDALASQFLWNNGLLFSHGTGHGVGFCLCVHEGPASISHRVGSASTEYPLQIGMVISDEPGVYLEGRHGVRIENLVAVQKAETTEFGNFFKFEFLTMCPYERDLIDKSMLTDEEIALVDSYHKEVLDKLSSKVAPEALAYLKEATKPL
jgi:Xaa-Pro aminopeptidase